MRASSAPANVRILPNNKVYRQLFDAQVQLSETYNRVRQNQLNQPVQIVAHPDAIPLVKNLRPHEQQKSQWVTTLAFEKEIKLDPVAILFRDAEKRRQNAAKKELEDLKQEVFNLPDDLTRGEIDAASGLTKENVTERLAAARQTKFQQLWSEMLTKLAELNQNLVKELEKLARECNSYYEQGNDDVKNQLEMMIYQKEITSLTMHSFENALGHLDRLLPPRLAAIQEYCQSMQILELDRVAEIRNLFKTYSERLYKTHHLTDEETAIQLEKQANDLNLQLIENRRIFTDLESRLLSGETDRVRQYRAELIDHQMRWKDEMWIIYRQTWISKLSLCRAKFDSTIRSTCEPISSSIAEDTETFIEHVRLLNSFIPPISTKENAEKWREESLEIVNTIVEKRQYLLNQIKDIFQNEMKILQNEAQTIREKVINQQIYDQRQTDFVFQRDIRPLIDEREEFLQFSLVDRCESFYTRSTDLMFKIIDHLVYFIETPADQWDQHQIRLEQVTANLLELMRECRKPHDLQNEKKLTKLDATLDEMRSAPSEATLGRLLTSAYDQLDSIKSSYGQFYQMEHEIVDRYANMINDEVQRYKCEMLDYFHVDEISEQLTKISPSRIYTTSISQTSYQIEEIDENSFVPPDKTSRMTSNDDDLFQPAINAFLTEDSSTTEEVPFVNSFKIPSNLVQTIMFNLCRAFLDHFDQWKEETTRRAEAVMYSKHDELEKEMDFQMHLHEPRRIRIETDIHNVRAAELVMHDERVERHIRGVQETLEQTDTDYRRMLNEFSKSIITYKDEIFALEKVFVNATTSGRLLSLQNRLTKKRDAFMEDIRVSLRTFRKRFDDAMQYLRQANIKFRKSFKMFSEGGNFSRDEIEVYRKKLEKAAGQIDKAETSILKEMEKLEKKQLEDATKIMNQFQERFKNHLTDLQFIETCNRWISETQVKIKGEVAGSNEQAKTFKSMVTSFAEQIDSLINPNLDKKTSHLTEVRQLFQQIVLFSYERALHLKCLQNELIIPSSLIKTLKDKGLITETELVNDLLNPATIDDPNVPRRASKMSTTAGSIVEESKSVKFASSTSPMTRASSIIKGVSSALSLFPSGQLEEVNTIATIRTLLHKTEQIESDEIVEPGIPAALGQSTRSIASASSTHSSQTKRSVSKSKKGSSLTSAEETSSMSRRDRPSRARTRDEIFALYCAFGEKPSPCQDFLAKILNILRDATEGLLSNAEIFYREKGSRPVTRPQAICEKFDEFAHTMIEKLRKYEDQCRTFHENSINEFRTQLESIERTASLMAQLELDEQYERAEMFLKDLKEKFDRNLCEKVMKSVEDQEKNFEELRPTLGHPSRKSELEQLDQREKKRLDTVQQSLNQFRVETKEDLQTNAQATVQAFASNSERLLILFDEILTADEIVRTKLPPKKFELSELVKRQQTGRPLEDSETTSLIERKQGHWPGLQLLEDPTRRRESQTTKKRTSAGTQRQKTSASIVTQKTTLPQVETIVRRDRVYQKYKTLFTNIFNDIEKQCSTTTMDFDRSRLHWTKSIEKLQQLRTC